MTELERCELVKRKGYTYNPETGELRGVKGNVITRKRKNGYIICSVKCNGKDTCLYGHRLAWYLYYGKLPNNYIDHIDGNKANNILTNLRDVTKQQNGFNIKKAKGYSWHKRDKKFSCRIKINQKQIHIGNFDTEEEARSAYLEAKEKYHVIP